MGLRRANDRDLWIRLAARADYWFVPDLAAVYRQHRGNISKSPEPPRIWTIRAYRKLLRHPDYELPRKELRQKLAEYYQVNARYFRNHRRFGNAFGAYLNSLRFGVSTSALRGLLASVVRRRDIEVPHPESHPPRGAV